MGWVGGVVGWVGGVVACFSDWKLQHRHGW